MSHGSIVKLHSLPAHLLVLAAIAIASAAAGAFVACADLMPDAPEISSSREASLDLDYITPTHDYLNSQYRLNKVSIVSRSPTT
jgi:hypothetical protein